MARSRSTDVTVGVLFALGLVILALGVMAVGGESRLFVSKTTFRIVFPNASGLVIGSPVKMAGVQIGTVSSIRLSTDPERSGIDVNLAVDSAYAERIRTDSTASLRILQLVSQEKFVEIEPGSPTLAILPEGSLIEPAQDPEILAQAAVAAENLNDITLSLKRVLAALESGEGLMGQMITDPDFGRGAVDSFRGTIENLELLSSDLVRDRSGGSGLVSRLLYDEKFAAKLDDLGRAIDSAASVSERLAALRFDEGALGALLESGGPGEQAVVDLRVAAASMRRATEALESSEGLLGRLLYDSEYSESLARDLAATMANLAEISRKINEGEGTLGALVNERRLHEGMEEVVAGVNDSKFARWLTRRYRKKGIKAHEREAESDPAASPGDGGP